MLAGADQMQVVEDMAGFRFDPLGHVLYSYPWGVAGGELAGEDGPWDWHRQTLDRIGAKLAAGELTGFADVVREAIASGHGIGKSAMIAWLIRWALDTLVDTRVLVTANTEKQLITRTWPEVAKWHNLGITRDWWELTATALYSKDPAHEKNWRADIAPWSENNTAAFAGLHNAGKRIVVIFDEASEISNKVWDVTEGALTDENTEIIWLVGGNPTVPDGRFRECFRAYAHRWHGQQIDARTVPGTNRKLHEQWVADYGEDSDFVKIRVRGIFPSIGIKSLIGEKEVDPAYGRVLRPEQYDFAPVILTCDPAWTGEDLLVIGKRQGLWYEVLKEIPRNDDDGYVAQLLAQYEDEYHADAVFVDLGYGTGIVSFGKGWGRRWELIGFGEASTDPGCLNKRAEMMLATRNWLREGGAIPALPRLRDDLLQVEVVSRPDGKLQLESGEHMKARGLPSPDHFMALALSFARPVRKKDRDGAAPRTASSAYVPPSRRR